MNKQELIKKLNEKMNEFKSNRDVLINSNSLDQATYYRGIVVGLDIAIGWVELLRIDEINLLEDKKE